MRQEVRFRVSKKVFHQASIYMLLVRRRGLFRIGILAVGAAAFYLLLSRQGLFPASGLPVYLAAAYLVWMLVLLGREEQRVLRYIKGPESLLNTDYVLCFDEHKLSVDVPEKGLHTALSFHKLLSALEISSAFLLYPSAQQLYLVPSDAMTEPQRTALRTRLQTHLGERFHSTVLLRQKKT